MACNVDDHYATEPAEDPVRVIIYGGNGWDVPGTGQQPFLLLSGAYITVILTDCSFCPAFVGFLLG
jgi:hypothetical protein